MPPIEGRAAFAFGFYLQDTRCYLFPEDRRQEAQTEAVSEADCAAMLEAMIAKVLQSGGDMRMPVQFLLLLFETMIREEVFQLEALEDGLSAIETQLLEEIPETFDETIVSYQKKLTSLHTYYEQLMNVGDMMCSNLDNYLPESQRRFWEHFTARAERLHDHTETLREYLMQIRSLYQHIGARILLFSALIIQCDVAQLTFKPTIITFGITGENFAVVGTLDVRYCKLSGDKGSHLLDYPCFRFREAESIYQIRFCYFFLHTL